MNYKLLYQWSKELARELPCLNSWQVENVSLFSQGVVLAEDCRQDKIARKVKGGEELASTERRWRRFISNASFPLEAFFNEWANWVCRRFEGERLYLLVDETKLQARFGVMMVGLAWEARCIPLIWQCYEANSSATYPEEGQVKMIEGLLKLIQSAIPSTKEVIVLADRGIGCSPDLCRAVEGLGWTFLFRVTKLTKICTDEGDFTIAAQVQEGEVWSAEGTVFKQRGRLPAQARAIWGKGYDEQWALVTNADALTGHEYALRNWQEQSFRDLKSGGWQWGDTRIRKPQHLARSLVVLVIAYTWMLSAGAYAVHFGSAKRPIRRQYRPLQRYWSLFKEGLNCFTVFMQPKSVCLTLCFVPDKRFT